jgi:hypothetical protein
MCCVAIIRLRHFQTRAKNPSSGRRIIKSRGYPENARHSSNWHLEDNLTLLRQLGAVKP